MGTTEAALRDLMVAGLSGDAGAHAALLRALVPLLRGFYRRRVRGGDDDIEDLVQETLMAVHTRRATWDPDRPFTAWLFAIARYKMVDQFRRHARLSPIEDAAAIAAAVNRRPKRTPYRRPKGTPFVERCDGYGGRAVRAGCGVGRA
ncbi:hypothetical protein COA17_15445 [Sphingomonas ginsenosidimutans]|uniref:RNA polymerase sigma-70 region 2 domain-containing protein n=1 Tax=Sphingomonas ginsenosidimutans TaxID=862134 RepID=A0A2A4HV43_9SPHN|nr:sigma factor [Sphingomonas ginsenosidimutans]PCG07893.1 hypothetical protein COA17_15445 [Sphingomonas ginsenosidimutans]